MNLKSEGEKTCIFGLLCTWKENTARYEILCVA